MKPISNATISSMYSSALGCVVILLWAAVTALIEANEAIESLASVAGALLIYSVSVVLVFVLAFVFGSPIYYLLSKWGAANYITSSVLGASFVLVIFGFGFGVDHLYWLLAGVITGGFYHYVYANHKNI